jgi:predicted nucleic acid-binding protein
VTRAIVDTGPLVAFLNTRDPYHAWARETFDGFRSGRGAHASGLIH